MQRRALYLRLGGERDVLGMWFQESEGTKFSLQGLSELKQRSVRDILICCVDGLTAFAQGDRRRHRAELESFGEVGRPVPGALAGGDASETGGRMVSWPGVGVRHPRPAGRR